MAETLLNEGLFQISWLRPEALFGTEGLSSIPHSVLWSMIFNIGAYLLGSLLYSPHKAERTLRTEFMQSMLSQTSKATRPTGLEQYILLQTKLKEASALLNNYLSG